MQPSAETLIATATNSPTECWMVIDDYYGADSNEKITPSRADVDALVAAGLLEPLGFYGWSTWVGRWRGDAAE